MGGSKSRFGNASDQSIEEGNSYIIGDGFLFLNDVYGPDFPGETFHVLKERKRGCGEYRTRRLVLEAWDNMELMHKSNGVRWDLL